MSNIFSSIFHLYIFFLFCYCTVSTQINFICCAKALCNLACAEEVRLRVAKEGGMRALMMISMVLTTSSSSFYP